VARKGRARLRALIDIVTARNPELDAAAAIRAGRVLVGGQAVTNPASLVRADAPIAIRAEGRGPLRGEAKLAAALYAFAVPVAGRIALDLGAAAGGFTRTLLDAGAARVYAVDAGFGQLLGSLRQDPRVLNLERTNLADLDGELVPEPIDIVSADLSYVSLARAIPQLEDHVALRLDADLLALVKPQFELGLARPPTERPLLMDALGRAAAGIQAAGWTVAGTIESPVAGARGAVEFLLHAARGRRGVD
jgi:23S rRNA (cytidine1920-2'-O)/16S rRNA (cytidine1409-2'-O)-methyltransferase